MSSNDPPLTPGGDGDDRAEEPSWEPTSEMPVVPPDEPFPDPSDGGPTEPLPVAGAEPAEDVSSAADDDDGSPTESDLSLTQQLARRRVSHRRYVMRRIAVAGVLVLLVGAAIAGIVLLAGGDGDGDGDETAASSPDTAVVTEPVILPTTTVARSTSTTEAPIVVEPTEAEAAAVETDADDTADDTVAETTDADETVPDATGGEATDLRDVAQDTDAPETEPEPTEPEETEATETTVPATTEADEIEYDLSLEPTCEMRGGAKVDQAGADVECLEERLMQITDDALDLDVDRVFDDATDAAVRAFQEHFELEVDGVVGQETASKLGIWPGSWPPDTDVTDTTNPDD